MKSQFVRAVVVSSVLGFATAGSAAAQVFVQGIASSPAQDAVSGRSQGRKGLRVLMGGTPGQFPIDASPVSVSVKLSVNGVEQTCTFNVRAPDPNSCGFIGTRFDQTLLHPFVDTIEIFFNGDFPATASIVETVNGVKGADATTQTVAGTVSFTADALGVRQTTSIELVFDTSGSMDLPLAASTNPSAKHRIAALKDSANELFVLLGAHAVVGDRIGQLFFNTDVSPGGGVLKAANDPTQIAALQSSLSGAAAGGSTGMGKGLQAAQSGLAGDPNTQQYMFVFSDGEQNVPPPSIDSPVPAGGPITVGGAPVLKAIKVCTITMGTQSAPGFVLQDQMSAVGCPHAHSLFVNDSDITFAQADLDSYFTPEIVTALGGDKLEVVRDVVGAIGAAPAVEKFHGNARDIAMSILVAWDQGRELHPQLTLTSPGGTVIDLTGRVTFSSRLALIDLHFPLTQGGATIDPKGLWQLSLSSPAGAAAATALNYHLIVVNDNSTINTDASLEISDAGTGEPIPINVVAKDGNTPVTGAAVTALLLGPDNGLGDILAKAANPSGNPGGNGDVVGSAANAKLLQLLSDPQFIALLQRHNLPVVSLTDSGNGVYTGTFTGALKEGHYQFLITLNGTNATNGDFDRTRKLTVFVRPKPSVSNTAFVVVSKVAQPNGTALVHLRATPRDRFGSFLGPDYLPLLNITCSPCTVSSPIADDLHGAYDVTYQLASPTANPTVGLVIFGQTVTQTRLDNLTGSGAGPGNGPFAISFHLGGTAWPSGSLSGLSGSLSVGADFEYRLQHGISLETYLGSDRFTSSAGDSHFVNLTERLNNVYDHGNWRPFVFAGVGGYFADGGQNHAGINVGGGIQRWLSPHLAVEGTYTFNEVFISSGDARYSTLLGGIRYVF